MATNSRNFQNVVCSSDRNDMAARYNRMLRNVNNMIANGGPIYSVWIMFQIGETSPIIFNSSSQINKENLIADLYMEKEGVGVANNFKLTIRYDPFRYGQDSTDEIEKLDRLIADAMSLDITSDDKSLRGYIQYGYNYNRDDTELVSPKYEYYLTGASSSVDSSSGMTTYTFEGTSLISLDCDFTANYAAVSSTGTAWTLINYVNWILYYYYGDSDNPPANGNLSGVPTANGSPKYKISIDKSLFDSSPEVKVEEQSGVSPWSYCKALLNGRMSRDDEQSDKYSDLSSVKSNQRPMYTMYITDYDRTIHVDYVSPLNSSNLTIDWTFTWNNQVDNIVTKWNPDVDLRLYLIQKARISRVKGVLTSSGYDIASISSSELNLINTTLNADAETLSKAAMQEKLNQIDNQVLEMFDAELSLVGIPADPPLLAQVRVIPKILESTSRTQGIYIIKGCKDTISSKGDYTSVLQLMRIKDLGD